MYLLSWTLAALLVVLSSVDTTVSAVPLTWPTLPIFDADNDAFVLPESINPTQYIVNLVPDIKSKKFHGEVNILGQTDDTGFEVNRIVLNADDLKVKSVQLVDLTEGAREVQIKNFVLKRIPQWLVVTLASNLSANSDYQLRIKFEGNFGVEAGMYHASYDDDYTKIGGDVAFTEFQTTYARKVFPCWDEPKYKASFIMRVARYPQQISLSNMPLKSTSVPDPHEDNRVWDTFEESPDMSTYLVAMVVAQLVSVHDPVHNLSIWTQPGRQEGAQYALNLTGQLMDRMDQYTGIPYTLPKLDQVALPKLRHQAMEHWGVIAFSERFLVVDDLNSLKQKQQVAFHISHELSHQWFGNLVTMEWWNYVWLNEGFAEFFQYFLLDMLEPTWRLMEIFVVNEMQSMLTHDSFLFTHPVTMSKVRSVVDIEKVFDSVSYCKGGALVRMLYHIMTPDLFQKAIRDYLQQNSLKSVTEDELWDSLSSVQTELNWICRLT
ncbi:hypothetical protein LSTR_LSTR008641 [Laodelphax striatellus]|uniref:Uncharacterized protein n=1 Tax=Laodelphax striatellus TaxID=195883 RepID=A0A482WMY0_LAOST|nr:hypothetical protein LSTR_LSTR008641 [Laodelphax striatellus]